MNMHWLDWSIIISLIAILLVVRYRIQKYTQSVADFLSANRCAGKYVVGIADGAAGLGAISIVALFEMYYRAGFTAVWWQNMLLPVGVIVAVSGWVQYRFRETRAMTMAQFFEVRYSRRFRIFAGLVAFVSGIVNFGIFPAVAARFFQYYCGFPTYPVIVGPFEIDLVYGGIMFLLVGLSVLFTVMGGQIVVMITDFLQGVFVNIMFVVITVYLLWTFDWSQISVALATAPVDASLANPLKTGDTENFNVFYFLIQVFGTFLTFMAWQGNQGYYGAAKNPHEAKIGRVIGVLRPIIQIAPLILLPIGAFTILHHPDFAQQAQRVRDVLNAVPGEQLRSQLTVSVALTQLLPIGILGGFAAVMFAAYLATNDTYLHSWGSIFVQDVILPIRHIIRGTTTPVSPKTHIRWLQYSITAVAVFIYLFSLLFNQQQDILMFFALTGTIFLGWAGTAIVGGLYWKRGTTAGAWVSAVIGMVLAVVGWYMTYFWANSQAICAAVAPSWWAHAQVHWPSLAGNKCPVTAQVLWFYTMLSSALAYVVISLLGSSGRAFDMDQLLHRGRYARKSEGELDALPVTGWRAFQMGKEYTFVDKCLVGASYLYGLVFFGLFLFGTLYALKYGIADSSWTEFWRYFCYAMLAFMTILTVWLAIGGTRDLFRLIESLRLAKRDARDDGSVVGRRLLDEIEVMPSREQRPRSE